MIRLNILMIYLSQMLFIILIVFAFGCSSKTQTENKNESSFIRRAITQKIVKNSIDKFLERTNNISSVSLDYYGDYSDFVGLVVIATNSSIEGAFSILFSNSWLGNIVDDAQKSLYNKIKIELSVPSNLKSVYIDHKIYAINYISSKGLKNKVKDKLVKTLPFIDGSLGKNIRDEIELMITKETELKNKEGSKEEWDELKQWKISLKTRDIDYLAFQWMKRRELEGENELVNTWIEIINDFKNSL